MTRTRLIPAVMAAGVVLTGLAAGLTTGSPVAADGSTAGYHPVIDDTGTITMLVPDHFAVDTSPVDWNGDGTPDPRIFADGGTDATGHYTGLVYVALPYDPSYQPWDGTCDPNGECPGLLVSDVYSDPEFTGFRQLIEGCCDSGIYETVDANADSGAFFAHVGYDYGETRDPAEVAVFETALASFTSTGNPLPAAPTPAPVQTSGPAVFPWVDFHDVPQLGFEPVRGTGCGSSGQVGDVIPDGIWGGFASVGGGVVNLDLVCVFVPQAAQTVITTGTANIINDDPYYLVVNNNPRVRVTPTAPTIQLRDGFSTVDGACVEGDATSDHSQMSDRQAWVNIEGGAVTWVFWGCAPFSTGPDAPSSPAPAGANLPPAYPDYSDGVGHVWPYGEFWNVPQLGSEPVRGSGCGAEGQIGSTIPDGLWAGFVDGYDQGQFGFWIDLLCIFAGSTAQAVLAEGTANILVNEPDYLVVNNNTQTRFVPDGLATFILGDDSGGGCVEGTHVSPEQLDLVAQNRQRQAWIRIDGGVATWIFYGCS